MCRIAKDLNCKLSLVTEADDSIQGFYFSLFLLSSSFAVTFLIALFGLNMSDVSYYML